jgi:hypothetical protein
VPKARSRKGKARRRRRRRRTEGEEEGYVILARLRILAQGEPVSLTFNTIHSIDLQDGARTTCFFYKDADFEAKRHF